MQPFEAFHDARSLKSSSCSKGSPSEGPFSWEAPYTPELELAKKQKVYQEANLPSLPIALTMLEITNNHQPTDILHPTAEKKGGPKHSGAKNKKETTSPVFPDLPS